MLHFSRHRRERIVDSRIEVKSDSTPKRHPNLESEASGRPLPFDGADELKV